MPPKKVMTSPIRMTPNLLAKITEASDKTGLSQADIIRLAISVGIEDMRKLKFDLTKLISDAAERLDT